MKKTTELERRRERLEGLLARLERRTHAVERDLRREAQPFSGDSQERAVELENQEVLEGLEAEGAGQIEQVRAALARIADGTWNRCADCGTTIPTARLDALPYATTCVRCAAARERAAN